MMKDTNWWSQAKEKTMTPKQTRWERRARARARRRFLTLPGSWRLLTEVPMKALLFPSVDEDGNEKDNHKAHTTRNFP